MSNSSETTEPDEAITEGMHELQPQVTVMCTAEMCERSPKKNEPLQTTFLTKKSLTNLFLIYSCKKLGDGYELSLKGQRIYQKLGRRLDDGDMVCILDYLSRGEIISLDLSNNIISDLGFSILCEYMLRGKLVNLNLRNNELKYLNKEGCKKLENVKSLLRLTLSGNFLSPETAEYFKALLRANNTLRVLELEGVNYYVHCVTRIADAIIDNDNTVLKVLNLSRLIGIPRYRLRSSYLADILYTLLVKNDTLVELHLEKNGITDHDVVRIMEGVMINRTLLVLNLSANFISDLGLERIAAILPESKLQVLLLRSNTIGNHGAIALSKAMPLSTIIHLDLAHNRIEDVGMCNLLWTIKKPTPLYTFYIFGNKFSKQTLEVIHMQMLRGKLMPNSLDIILYWDEDGTMRCSYNPDADLYRNQMQGLYSTGYVAKNDNILAYPSYDILNPYKSLKRYNIKYPKPSQPKILADFKDHITVK